MPAADSGDAEARARYRRFVKEHHPDVGGDPEVFAAGIDHFRSEQLRAARGKARDPDARYDAPIVVLSDWQLMIARLLRLLRRIRRVPPRVE